MTAVVEQIAVDLARQQQVVSALRAFLPAGSILFDTEDVKPYECDGLKKYIGTASPNLLGAVFGFGLIHGFGLSTRLQQLPLGHDGLVLKILSFNVGVEFGQIAALLVMGFVLNLWRSRPSFAKFSHVANVALLCVGVLLFLMQLHGYQHTRYPDDFPLNRDDHGHVHADMAAADEYAPITGASVPAPSAHRHADGTEHKH